MLRKSCNNERLFEDLAPMQQSSVPRLHHQGLENLHFFDFSNKLPIELKNSILESRHPPY